MPRPTRNQLKKINQLSLRELEEDQVYVFTSLSADTKPVKRMGWFGEFEIKFTSKMLNDLKKSYKTGVGLLASHDKNRLPFGRSFDAQVKVDYIDGEPVETLYIDHYIVTHVKDDEGNKVPLRTEIGGLTTQDIVNHIEAGHVFDTSIGFSINKPICSICGNDLRDFDKCRHLPGLHYEVDVDGKTEKRRCDVIVDGGEGIENSLVYAGAVDRAIIQRGSFDQNQGEELQNNVNLKGSRLYNVNELKKVPLNAKIFCRLSKDHMELFATTPERDIDFGKGSEEMAGNDKNVEMVTTELEDVVSKEEFDKAVSEKEALSAKVADLEEQLQKYESEISELKEQLSEKDELIASLQAKSELADQFTEDLIQETVKAGVKARGNVFNAERYEKYLRTLSVDEIKEELKAFKDEFSKPIEDARVTAQKVEGKQEEIVQMSEQEIRNLAARRAIERHKSEGGNLEALTKEELAKLKAELNK